MCLPSASTHIALLLLLQFDFVRAKTEEILEKSIIRIIVLQAERYSIITAQIHMRIVQF